MLWVTGSTENPAGPSVGDSKPTISGNCLFKRDCAIIMCLSVKILLLRIVEDTLRPLKSFHLVGRYNALELMTHSSWVGEEVVVVDYIVMNLLFLC